MKLAHIIAACLVLLFAQTVATFQSYDRTVFDCQLWCRNPHILYSLSLPIFLLSSVAIAYLLHRNNGYFKAVDRGVIPRFILRESRAFIWIWLFIGIYSYWLANTSDIDNLRGPFVLGVLITLIYTTYNAISTLSARRK
jgi:hypothetical protein